MVHRCRPWVENQQRMLGPVAPHAVAFDSHLYGHHRHRVADSALAALPVVAVVLLH
jgi:hypothetical protein